MSVKSVGQHVSRILNNPAKTTAEKQVMLKDRLHSWIDEKHHEQNQLIKRIEQAIVNKDGAMLQDALFDCHTLNNKRSESLHSLFDKLINAMEANGNE